MIKVKHPNGYEGIIYGQRSMEIWKDGKEVLHTGSRKEDIQTAEDLYKVLEDIPEELAKLDALMDDLDNEEDQI